VPQRLRSRYFQRVSKGEETVYEVSSEVSKLVSFARLNLMGEWPMRGQFDLILCRNVMIYFNDDTRTILGRRFAEVLTPDGVLLIGHAESLANLAQPLRVIQPAIYAH
jgi:chemotaxis protein methyltransferase CheR